MTRTQLEELSGHDQGGIYVSLYMPTHRSGSGMEADPLSWKNLVAGVTSALTDKGLRKPEIDELLAPAWALHEDGRAWQYMSEGLAVFLRPGWHREFRVPVHVPELATVGDRFIISPLLPVISGDGGFLLLTISQRQIRLLEGTRDRVSNMDLGEIPVSLRDVSEPREPRSGTVARSLSGGPSGAAVFFGHGGTDDDFKTDEVRRFLQLVGKGLHDILAELDLPMVVVGLEKMLGIYREVRTYPHVVGAVRQNPDQLSDEKLHAAAWPVIEEHLGGLKRRAIDGFGQLQGTGRASMDGEVIGQAAVDGRVETLFLDPCCWQRIGADSPAVISLGQDTEYLSCEQLDLAAVGTLSGGGQVHTVDDGDLPGGGPVAAVFRY
ncbi:hypothetical protein [Paenarthrobacter sp. PH39-S1]|uniref:baeRF3 domain-containing protein n=1 Tax=Paenarthrobacter sp. PH39-S1 TaxID=3046204 RepID=UPI0024BA86EF|nr:hypothetical protein [Paenarthrobacter sp. PH39-S1]MDJ0356479.1 hypothetical protein [Paenarthrobacter sp. PH39-S1]